MYEGCQISFSLTKNLTVTESDLHITNNSK